MQHNWQGCYVQLEVKEKRGIKKKKRKKQSFIENTKESINERLTGRSLCKHNLGK